MQLRDLGEFALIARIERAARRVHARAGVALGHRRRRGAVARAAGRDLGGVDRRADRGRPLPLEHRDAAHRRRDRARRGALRPRRDGRAAARVHLRARGARRSPARDVRRARARTRRRAARRYECPLVGGNLARASETSLVTTVFGGVARGRALRRRARVGDRILVTGELGAAALARARAERRGTTIRRIPVPRLAQGRALARIPAVTGCIDVSDGLTADLAHLLGPRRRCAIDPARAPAAARLRRGLPRARTRSDRHRARGRRRLRAAVRGAVRGARRPPRCRGGSGSA